MKLLEKGLNFCPSSKNANKEELLDDIFAYSRTMRLKHFFHNLVKNQTSSHQPENASTAADQTNSDGLEPEERCEASTYPNPNLENYLGATKSDVFTSS